MNVVKRNKRLLIVNEDGEAVYSPPDFIRLHSREPLRQLAHELEHKSYIDAVMAFEAAR